MHLDYFYRDPDRMLKFLLIVNILLDFIQFLITIDNDNDQFEMLF